MDMAALKIGCIVCAIILVMNLWWWNKMLWHPSFPTTYKWAQDIFDTAELCDGASIFQWLHWQCCFIGQDSVVDKVSSNSIAITNRLCIGSFCTCNIERTLATSIWGISCSTPICIHNPISIFPWTEAFCGLLKLWVSRYPRDEISAH